MRHENGSKDDRLLVFLRACNWLRISGRRGGSSEWTVRFWRCDIYGRLRKSAFEEVDGMAGKVKRIQLSGYKSIQNMDLALGDINVLIGANGAGKSNFLSALDLIRSIFDGKLQYAVAKSGGADTLLHYGVRTTDTMGISLKMIQADVIGQYDAKIEYAVDDELFFAYESAVLSKGSTIDHLFPSTVGKQEARIAKLNSAGGKWFTHSIGGWRFYQFDDTSSQAKIRFASNTDDNLFLRENGGNLAAFLYAIQHSHPSNYGRIVGTIRLTAPFFDDFVLSPNPLNPNKIQLRWKDVKGEIFGSHQLSDGTLRMIALATVLLQPQLPSLIMIDEPELGLHPFAIEVLADLLRAASRQTQIVVSTQSPSLVNQFSIEDLIVVEWRAGVSQFERKSKKDFETWLEDYTLGDLWEMNLLGGRPSR
jgi:predicted ATPase